VSKVMECIQDAFDRHLWVISNYVYRIQRDKTLEKYFQYFQDEDQFFLPKGGTTKSLAHETKSKTSNSKMLYREWDIEKQFKINLSTISVW